MGGVSFVRAMRILFVSICLCLAASVHGFFGKLLATKKELTKSCRTEEVTTFSTVYSTECGHALREVCANEYSEKCADEQVPRYEEECTDEVISKPEVSCKPGGYNQIT